VARVVAAADSFHHAMGQEVATVVATIVAVEAALVVVMAEVAQSPAAGRGAEGGSAEVECLLAEGVEAKAEEATVAATSSPRTPCPLGRRANSL